VPTTATVATFLLASVVLVLIPGPSVMFIVGRALAQGRRAALLSVAGSTTGAAVLVVAVATGFGAVALASMAVFTVLKFVGAGYLVFLGVQAFRHRGDLAGALTASTAPAHRLYRQGFVVGATNPKTVVFFAAVLPQFVDPHGGAVTGQMLVLGLVFLGVAIVLDVAWALAAGAARDWFATSPARLRRVGGTGGLMMIGLGVGLAATGRGD